MNLILCVLCTFENKKRLSRNSLIIQLLYHWLPLSWFTRYIYMWVCVVDIYLMSIYVGVHNKNKHDI